MPVRSMTVAIVGQPGLLSAWRAATARDLTALPGAWDHDIDVGVLGKRRLVLGWIGTVCDVRAILAVELDHLTVMPRPRHGCDAMAIARGVVLTYVEPIDPGAFEVTLTEQILIP